MRFKLSGLRAKMLPNKQGSVKKSVIDLAGWCIN